MSRPVQLREAAHRDVTEAVQHLASEAGRAVARDFVASFEQAVATVGDQPGIGSPWFADVLDIPGLRTWPLQRFPYLLFYRYDDDLVDLWRVLHTSRDLPASFRRSPGG